MRLEAKKYLFDIKQAADLVEEFAAYEADAMLRAAVEREFEIIGEALGQLARLDEGLAGRVSGHRRIIAFRNILIHGYAHVGDRLVWDIVESRLPVLRREVTALLEEQ